MADSYKELDGSEEPAIPVACEQDPNGRYTRYDVVLGRGAFKTVYKAFDEEEGLEVAWNQVKVNDLVSSPAERERLFAEIRVLKQLKHKNIMTFYDSWLDTKNLTVNFITELFTSGTLRQYRKKHKHIDNEVLKRWAWHILQGLVYLHGHNPPIIHRDLKCDNIFVNGTSGVVKIGDLGLVTLCRGFTTPQSVLGTPEFMAPELYEEKYDEKVDVYSFGMCLLELATMEYPYSECKNAAQIYKKVTQGIHPAGLAKVQSQALREFIEVCIQHDPQQRPEARQLLKHSFFESVRAQLSCGGFERSHSEKGALIPVEVSEPIESPETATTPVSAITPETSATDVGLQQQPLQQAYPVGKPPLPPPPQQQPVLPDVAGSSGGGGGPYLAQAEASISGQRTDGLGGAAAYQQHLLKAAGDKPAYSTSQQNLIGSQAFAGDLQNHRNSSAPLLASQGSLTQVSQEDFHRDFNVLCRQMDERKLSFSLRYTEPHGHAKTVEFAFDMDEDTAECIASEMMEDLSLSAEEAKSIAGKIKQEIQRMTSPPAAVASVPLPPASTAPQQPQQQALPVSSSLPALPVAAPVLPEPLPLPAQGPAPPSMLQIPTVDARDQQGSSAAVSPSFASGGLSSKPTTDPGRLSSNGFASKSGYQTPDEGSLKRGGDKFTIHELIAAMREVHQEESLQQKY